MKSFFISILCVILIGLHLSAGRSPVEVRFESQQYETSESSNQQVCLVKTGYTHSSFSVVINTHAAVADESDYTPLHDFRVLFQPGTVRFCFTINIVRDLVVEEKESFVLSLQEPAGGLPSGVTINTQYNGTVIKIVDNDVPPNCGSFLRFTRPDLFRHCTTQTCSYGPFTRWASVPGTTVPAPLATCNDTGQAQVQSRNQTAPEPGCPAKIQRRLACTQTQVERLIRTFNLGSPSFNVNGPPGPPGPPPGPPSPPSPPGTPIPPRTPGPSSSSSTGRRKRNAPSAYCSSTGVCQGIPTTPRSCTPQAQCEADHGNVCHTRSMVFVLDTSGSIGITNFRRMTNAISNFVPLFCDNLQVAVVSYSSDINVEFCFNCHNLCSDQSCGTGRANVQSAIQGIQYRGGSTLTGPATRCVHDNILNPSWGCGVNTSADCLDIIYVTDGQSNGPLHYPQTCQEATCLKNHPTWCGRVNIYAIAIGNGVNRNEINCLTQNNEKSVFNVDNFEEFEDLVFNAQQRIASSTTTNQYLCVKQRDREILL